MAWIERADRREKKAKVYQDSDNPRRFRAEFTIHDQHYNNGGHWDEVDEDIADDGAGGFDKTCDKTRHKIRFAGNGRRRWYPRRDVDEYVEITGIEYWSDQGGGRWRNLTLPAAMWKKQGATWERNDLRIEVINTWKRVKETFTLLNSDAPTRLRFGLELSGLAYDHATGQLTSTIDGLVWGSIDKPTALDANDATVPVTATYDGTWLEWSADTGGAIFPVTVDPTFTDGTGGDTNTANDTHVDQSTPDASTETTTMWQRGGTSAQKTSLIKFTLTSLADVTIDSATFYAYRVSASANSTVTIRRILSANSYWTEAAATWNYQDGSGGGHRWAGDTGNDGGADAGCSVSGTDSSSTELGTYTTATSDSDGTEYTSSWNLTEFASMIGANYGISLRSSYSYSQNQIGSSDNATTGYRPKLVVEYTAGGATDDLTATGIATGAPTVGTPTIGQFHGLTATGIAAGAPTVGAPALSGPGIPVIGDVTTITDVALFSVSLADATGITISDTMNP